MAWIILGVELSIHACNVTKCFAEAEAACQVLSNDPPNIQFRPLEAS